MADPFDATRQKRKQRVVPDEAVLVTEEEIEVVEVVLAVVGEVEEGSVIEEIEEGSEVIEAVEEGEEGSVIEVVEAVEVVSEVTEVEVVPRRPFFKVTGGSLKCCSQSISLDKLLMLVLLFRFDRFARLTSLLLQ